MLRPQVSGQALDDPAAQPCSRCRWTISRPICQYISTRTLLTARAARSCPAARVRLMESSSSLYSAVAMMDSLMNLPPVAPGIAENARPWRRPLASIPHLQFLRFAYRGSCEVAISCRRRHPQESRRRSCRPKGLLQTKDYARALLITMPKATDEVVATRLAARMERQRRTIGRPDPPGSWLIVDELSLYRLVGSAVVMAAQLRHLLNVVAMPGVTVQVLPAVAHPATAGELIITDDAAYVESLVGGAVLGGETVSSLMALFDSLRGECYRVSESVALIERLAEAWESGASPLTAARTAGAV